MDEEQQRRTAAPAPHNMFQPERSESYSRRIATASPGMNTARLYRQASHTNGISQESPDDSENPENKGKIERRAIQLIARRSSASSLAGFEFLQNRPAPAAATPCRIADCRRLGSGSRFPRPCRLQDLFRQSPCGSPPAAVPRFDHMRRPPPRPGRTWRGWAKRRSTRRSPAEPA